jgi:hypothetical protein
LRALERLAERLRVASARDWSFSARGAPLAGTPRARLVIAAQHNPTVDYYARDAEPRLAQRIVFDADVGRWQSGGPERLEPGTQVVLARMPASAWANVLQRQLAAAAEIVWLIDDDVVAARDDAHLPRDYRLRLLSDYLRFKRAFEPLVTKVWASTPQIASRYPAHQVELRPPQALGQRARRQHWITVFYHGTSAHRAEHEFLAHVFRGLQARSERTVIEVCGDHALRRSYGGIPRLRVVHPMPWPDYLSLLEAGRYDLGLVPLLDTPFNRGRSAIKAMELEALGIPAVISRRAPHLELGKSPEMRLVDDDVEQWVATILDLAATSR